MNEIYELLQTMNMPVAYHHFTKQTNPPFICYFRESSNNFIADNKVYQKIDVIRIELYTEKKDIQKEIQLECLLEQSDIPYEVISESYIESEKVYQVIYEINI